MKLMGLLRRQAPYATTVAEMADEPDLVRFLFGDVPAGQRAQIEDRIFGDAGLFEDLCALEEEFVRDYLRRELYPEEEAAFEARLAVSPDLRRRVETARALMVALGTPSVSGPDAAVAARRRPWWATILAFPRPSYTLACVCVTVVALIGAMWFGFDNRRLRTQLTGSISHSGTATPITISFTLASGATMGSSAGPVRLRIPPAAAGVHIDLLVRAIGDYREFHAELRELDHDLQSWSGITSRSRSSGTGVVVGLQIPAAAFAEGDYIILLKGLTPGGHWEDLPSYSFGVVRR